MTDDKPAASVDGKFPLQSKGQQSPASIELTSNRLEISLDGQPSRVDGFASGGEFGVIAYNVQPETVLDALAIDAEADTVWEALANVLRELSDAGCNHAEMFDYIATRKCGFDREEWSDISNASPETVRQNANRVERKLSDD